MPWIDKWKLDEMFSGVPGCGAEDASYSTAMLKEWFAMQGLHYSGSAADIYKCYDQLVRPLIKVMLLIAGCPKRIVLPYMHCLDNLVVFNVFAGHVGRPHQHFCGLPQGCPFSMMVLSLLLRPWIMKCRELHVQPRTLADDILIIVGGHDHLRRTIQATEFTQFLSDLGAKGAPNKSFSFSSCPVARKWLSLQVWQALGTHIPVRIHTRDLGAHLSTGCRLWSTTLASRMRAAKPIANRVGRVPANEDQKDNAITAKVNKLALYGSETQPIPEGPMSELQSAIVSASGPKSSRRSPAIVFSLAAARGKELDPNVEQVVRKVKLLRRTWYKRPQDRDMIRDNLHACIALRIPGTMQDDTDLAMLSPAPPPGAKGRHLWPKHHGCQGPIGLLARELYLVGAVIDSEFVIHKYHGLSIDLFFAPWQHLGRSVAELCARARVVAAPDRNSFHGLIEIDMPVLQHVRSKIPKEDIKIFDCIVTGAVWDQDSKVSAGQDTDSSCPHCHAPTQGIAHTLHGCPGLNHIRCKHKVWSSDVDPNTLPNALLLGLPLAMCIDPSRTFWGQSASQVGVSSSIVSPSLGVHPSLGIHGLQTFPGTSEHIPASTWVTIEAMSNNSFGSSGQVDIDSEYVFDNARLLFANLRGHQTIPSVALRVDACNDVAPTEPNVFSDGGLCNPSKARWQLGGYGVWCPNRSSSPTEAEDACANTAQVPGGVELWSSNAAMWYSSTRLELAGGTLALLSPGPVHIASDSASFLRMARSIVAHPYGRPKRPWGLMPDGDLWNEFQQAVIAKGPHAVDLSKVKGHATDDMVQQGYSAQLKIGNDRSDTLATRGRSSFAFAALAGACSQRQDEYASFMLALAIRNIAVFKEDQRMRESLAKIQKLTGQKGLVHIASSAPYPSLAECRAIELHQLDSWPKDFVNGHAFAYRQVWAFLSLIRVRPTVMPESGATWLELLLLFEQMGGTVDLKGYQVGPQVKAVSIKRRISDFQHFVRAVVKRFVVLHDQCLFKASPSVQKRLLCLGFTNHTPKLSFVPFIRDDQISCLTHGLLSLRCNFTRNMARLHKNNIFHAKPCRILLRPAPKWTRHLDIRDELSAKLPPLPEGCPVPSKSRQDVVNSHTFLRCFQLVCPSCGAVRPHGSIDPFSQNKWKVIKCMDLTCSFSSTAKNWFCQCHRPWYSCPIHSSWVTHVKCFQMFCQVSRFRPVCVPQSSMQVPILAGIRRKRIRLGPRRPSTYVSKTPGVGGAPFVGGRLPTSTNKAARRKFDMPSGPGHGRANSLPSSSFGFGPQDPSTSCSTNPTSTHAPFEACPSGDADRIRRHHAASEAPPQDLNVSGTHYSSTSTQALLNACSSGDVNRIRQNTPASGVAMQAKCNSRKLGSQPIAAPSPELLAKLARKFLPHLTQHPKGDG